MASLLDLLGSASDSFLGKVPDVYSGLLSEEDLINTKSMAQKNALANMAKAFYAAGAPQKAGANAPSTLSAINDALLAGRTGFKEAVTSQVQEKLNQDKIKEALASRQRNTSVLEQMKNLYQPPTASVDTAAPVMSNGVNYPGLSAFGETGLIEGQQGGLNQDVMRQLMSTPEGQAQLQKVMTLNKSMQPERFSVAQGANEYSTNPLTGQTSLIAAGTPNRSTLQKDFEYAKSIGYLGSIDDWKALGASKTTNIVNPLQPDKTGIKSLQDTLNGSLERQMRFGEMSRMYDPKFLKIPFRAMQGLSSMQEKFGVLPPEQRQDLQDFSKFKQGVTTNLNKTIQEITGAAMSEPEAKRIGSTVPNAGTGLFDGDSPTEFKAKMDETVRLIKLVEARNVYMLRKGYTLKDVSIDSMPQIINDRGKEIAKENNLNMNNPNNIELIKRQLSAEFGITNQ